MKKNFTIIFLLAALTISKPNFLTAQVNVQDSLALIALYDSSDGQNWYPYDWNLNQPVSKWPNVLLSNNRVIALYLSNEQLEGIIPASLGNLTNLITLDLSSNIYLKGSIPPQLGNLSQLEVLSLAADYGLSGAIPSELGNLTNLTGLNLKYDLGLSGHIPYTLTNLTKLVSLDLTSNHLTGTIPSKLGSLKKLRYLYLGGNHFTGNIPASLGNLNLKELDLSGNYLLSGNIPPELGNLVNLKYLSLAGDGLAGSIPHEFGNLIKLTKLDLHGNVLTGSIPIELGNLILLQYLDLSSNQLSDTIPSSLNKLTYLFKLFLNNNKLSGRVIEFKNLKFLNELHLEYNNFTFAGMQNIATAFPFATYYSQANIPLTKKGLQLSVSAGGTLIKNTYNWYRNDTLYKTKVGDSIININSFGVYYVEVTNSIAKDLILRSDTINYSSTANLFVDELSTANKILSALAYPNPAKSSATLLFNAEGKYTITISDVSGKILQTKTGIAKNNTNMVKLDVSKYSSGLYLITVSDEKNKKQTLRLNKE